MNWTISLCCLLPHLLRTLTHYEPLDDFKTIWKSEDYTRFSKKHFVRDNGVIQPRRGVEFNLPRYHKKKYSLYRQRSTPYPSAPLSKTKTPSTDDLPIGDYTTISRYPLDGGFIHHYIRPAAPEPSTSSIIPKEEPLPTIQATRTMPKIKIDWITYQGGMGSRFNPIIVEDD